jgi:hypothetical protein
MATTTNYSWTTPDDTALVKDGAAAIRSLGTAIDTTTKNLNPSTTLGDIEYRSSTANTNTRLGIGTTGQVLTVSGGVPAWSALSAGGMTLLASGTLSGAALSLTSISSAYNELQLKIYNPYNSAGDSHSIRINNISAANYQTAFIQASASTVANTTDATSIACVGGTSSSTAYGTVIFTIPNYKATTAIKTGLLWSIRGDQGNGGRFGSWNLNNNQLTTAINRIDFLTASGTFSGGTYELWGIK